MDVLIISYLAGIGLINVYGLKSYPDKRPSGRQASQIFGTKLRGKRYKE